MTNRFPRHALLALLLAASAASFAQTNDAKAARFYEDALQRFDRKDYAGAIIQLKNSLQVDKSQLSVHLLLGKALLADSQVVAAETEFGEALRLGVDRAEVVVPLAQTLIAQGKHSRVFDDTRLSPTGLPSGIKLKLLLVRSSAASDIGDTRTAMQSVLDARAIDAYDAETWLAEVPLRVRAHQFPEAMAAAGQALKLAPDSSNVYYQKASVLHVQGRINEALPLYERSIQLNAGNVEARLARAGILFDLNRDKDLQAELDELQRQVPNDPRCTYLRAQLASRSGNDAVTKAALKRVTELLDPVPVEFIRYRLQILMLNGLAHFDLHEYEKAKGYLELATRQQPGSPLTKLLAQIAISEPNVPRAIELLEDYLKTNAGDGQALLMLATAQMAQGRYAKASQLLQDALQSRDDSKFRTALGISLMRSGKSGTAQAELERAFKADPKQTYAGMALVDIYQRSGQLPRALQVADGLAKADPKNPIILVVQAGARQRAGDFAGARAGYDAALKLDSQNQPALLGLAHVDALTRNFDAADKRLRAALKGNERSVDILFELATLYELWGRSNEALAYLQSAVDASSQTQTRPNFALVAWQLKRGTPAAALDAAKVLLSKLPDDVDALRTYAQAQLAGGDAAGARSTLNNAARRAAYDAPQLERIARSQLDARDIPGAAYSLDKALTGDPNNLPAMALMSTVELLQGDTAKAERRAREVMQQFPKAGVGWGLLADVAMARGQSSVAIDALRHAHDLDRSEASLLRLFNALSLQDGGKAAIDLANGWLKTHAKDIVVQKALGDAYARAGNFSAARRSYEAVIAARPSDVDAMNNLANVLIQQQDAGAVAIAEKALALDPRNPVVVDTAGWAYFKAGNKDRALQLLRDARLRAPENPDLRYRLAVVLAQTGRSAEARDELQAALKNKNFNGTQDAQALMSTLK
ncbi:PEP-CTERM system TPR-repeat protein PrsT [Paucibacter sp. R3-3]|uniref:PEP-CTERM system TPR-repeat protein PrsT n=1 Tax=Roseateles agri TaxID=3098619 RepID=A0ABU5DK25_9BURK|nr:XrtA/PEP-CTERM system TPR-repeat protein PrsT [Paucibacter sp. R3-3]MDY0746651.1 PEP-CTERM system TPR-repeat protein PrsT [Paucibacter sp. R3-3]